MRSQPLHSLRMEGVSTDADNPRLALIYQRPVEDPYSGGSAHIRGFASALADFFDMEIVAPSLSPRSKAQQSDSPMTSVSNIVRANMRAFKWVLGQANKSPTNRAQVIVSFDVYAALFPMLWGRVTRTPLVYYAQDLGRDVTRAMRERGYRGARLLGMLRTPLESAVIAGAGLIAGVSTQMVSAMEAAGISRVRLEVCALTRSAPVPNLPAIRKWQSALGTDSHIGVVFVGNLAYPPNLEAARFIQSTLADSCGDLADKATFVLVGKGTASFQRDKPPRVVGLGPVEDLGSVLYACHIGLAPMPVSGGVSGKVVDYLLHGLDVVATPEVAAAIGTPDAVVSASLANFAGAISELLAHAGTCQPGYLRGVPPEAKARYLGDNDVAVLAGRIAKLIGGATPR